MQQQSEYSSEANFKSRRDFKSEQHLQNVKSGKMFSCTGHPTFLNTVNKQTNKQNNMCVIIHSKGNKSEF